jgi:Purple acid Phosphatase, N-terminal domain/Calcineurin-like phosphoesterase
MRHSAAQCCLLPLLPALFFLGSQSGLAQTLESDFEVSPHVLPEPNGDLLHSTAVKSSGAALTVAWRGFFFSESNVSQPFVGLSCGRKESDSLGNVLVRLDLDAGERSSGRGQRVFGGLVPLRCDFLVQLVLETTTTTSVVSSTSSFRTLAQGTARFAEGPGFPRQLHLSLADLSSSVNPGALGATTAATASAAVVVRFTSSSVGGDKSPFVARWGLAADELDRSAVATEPGATYGAADMCGGRANVTAQALFRPPGTFHEIRMDPLEHGRRYYYRVGSNHDGWSPVRSFRAPQRRGSMSPVKFIAYGDMGGWRGDADPRTVSARIFESMLASGYDSFVLHAGDVSYAEGKGHVWDQFMTLVEPFASSAPFQVAIGNHEWDHAGMPCPPGSDIRTACSAQWTPSWGNFGTDSGGECGVPMFHRFGESTTGPLHKWYYSFDYG